MLRIAKALRKMAERTESGRRMLWILQRLKEQLVRYQVGAWKAEAPEVGTEGILKGETWKEGEFRVGFSLYSKRGGFPHTLPFPADHVRRLLEVLKAFVETWPEARFVMYRQYYGVSLFIVEDSDRIKAKTCVTMPR